MNVAEVDVACNDKMKTIPYAEAKRGWPYCDVP
jgi:hypothetical protein